MIATLNRALVGAVRAGSGGGEFCSTSETVAQFCATKEFTLMNVSLRIGPRTPSCCYARRAIKL